MFKMLLCHWVVLPGSRQGRRLLWLSQSELTRHHAHRVLLWLLCLVYRRGRQPSSWPRIQVTSQLCTLYSCMWAVVGCQLEVAPVPVTLCWIFCGIAELYSEFTVLI